MFFFFFLHLVAASSLDGAVGSDVALSRARVRDAVLSVVGALELRTTGTGRVAANVGAHGFLALLGNVVCGIEARGLLEAGGDDIVVVVATTLIVGLLELVKGTALALVVLTTGLSV